MRRACAKEDVGGFIARLCLRLPHVESYRATTYRVHFGVSVDEALSTVCLAVAALLIQVPALANELPDCKLDQGNFPGKALRGFKLQGQDRYFMEISGELKNGTENIIERDEAILNVDMKVVRTMPIRLAPKTKMHRRDCETDPGCAPWRYWHRE